MNLAEQNRFSVRNRVSDLAWSPDERFLLLSMFDKSFDVRASATGAEVLVCASRFDCHAAWSSGSARFAVSDGQSCTVWDGRGLVPVFTFTLPDSAYPADHITCLDWSPDDQCLALGRWGGSVQVWDCAKQRLVSRALPPPWGWDGVARNQVHRCAWSPEIPVVATAHADRCISLWNAGTGDLLDRYRGHVPRGQQTSRPNNPFDPPRQVVWSPDGDVIASCYGNSVHVWELHGLRCVCRHEHARRVSALAFDPQGSYIASADEGGTTHVWHAGTGEVCQCLAWPPTPVCALAFSPLGTRLAAVRAKSDWSVGEQDVIILRVAQEREEIDTHDDDGEW